MKKRFVILPLLSVFITLIFFQACTKTSSQPQEYIADSTSFKNFSSWPLQSTKHGPDPLLMAMAHANNDSTVVRDKYFKNGQNAVNGKYPTGTIVVKHSYNPKGTVNEFTGMVKRGNNFDAAHNDWEYFVLKPDGTIMTNTYGMIMRGANLMGGMCVSCHGGASGKDYIFSK